jgi:hypothetical protein
MRVGRYDNSHNRNKVRIDARPQNDPATQAGLRNVHRDTRGNVIGGVTAEGQGIGTKARGWQTPPSPNLQLPPEPEMQTAEWRTSPIPGMERRAYNQMMQAGGGTTGTAPAASAPAPVSRLGNPSTPGLDRLAAMQPAAGGTSFADQDKAARERSAASGAFGKRAQNLSGRRKLFKDMEIAGSGAQSPDFAKRAAKLGVPKSRYNRAWSKIPQAPASDGITAVDLDQAHKVRNSKRPPMI